MVLGNVTFPIQKLDVPAEERRDEQLGSKAKFWFKDERGQWCLWKRGRANEDWSEKLTAELGRLLGIPCASVDLAACEGHRGIVSPSFLSPGDRLVHGNEVLLELDQTYPNTLGYRAVRHTVEAALDVLAKFAVAPWPNEDSTLPATFDGRDLFVGYLLFDAWIGNTDRHHENWAVVQRGAERYLAPSYDHASSLGRNEPLRRIQLRLQGTDPRCTVQAYADACRSAFYAEGAAVLLHPAEAFAHAAARHRDAAAYWCSRLDAVTDADIQVLMDRIPPELWAEPQRILAMRLLDTNRQRIRVSHG